MGLLLFQVKFQECLLQAESLYSASVQRGSTDNFPAVRARCWHAFRFVGGLDGHHIALSAASDALHIPRILPEYVTPWVVCLR